MKHFLKNINLLNILILCAVLLFANYTILPLLNMSVPRTLPSGKTTSVHKDEQPAEIDVPLLTDYAMIADDNLFHPERRIPVETVDEQSLPKPEFVLFGTLLTDDIRLAYIKDRKAPLNTGGRGDRQTAMKIGDTMSGYILQEIYTDKVVMAKGEDRLELRVIDFTRERAQDKETTKPQVPKKERSAMHRKAAQSLNQSLKITKQRGTSDIVPEVKHPTNIPRSGIQE